MPYIPPPPLPLSCLQLADHFHVGSQTVKNWLRGYYIREGKRIYFYSDHHHIPSVSGKGKKGSPYQYDLHAVQVFIHGIYLGLTKI